MRILSFITLFLILSVTHLYATVATFLDEAEVPGNYVTLGDIVTFSENNQTTKALATQRIATAPVAGQSILLDSHNILRQLASQHLLPADVRWKGASEISITRKGITITPDKIKQILNQFLQTKAQQYPDAELTFTPQSFPLPFTLPAGDVSWEVIPSRPGLIGSSRFSIIFRVDNKLRKNLSVRGQLKALMPVAVANQTIKNKEPLTANNVRMEMRDVARTKGVIFDLHDLSGKQASRTIRAGKIIEQSQLKSIPLVYRGEQVKVLLRSGALQLTAKGIAKADGGLHDVIRVQNTSSNKTFYCQVAAPGLVEVKL